MKPLAKFRGWLSRGAVRRLCFSFHRALHALEAGLQGQERTWNLNSSLVPTDHAEGPPIPSVTLQTQQPLPQHFHDPLPTTFLWLYNTVFPPILWHFIKAARRWYCPFSRSEINSSFIASGNAWAAVRTCDRFSQLQDLWSILYLHLHRSPIEWMLVWPPPL